MAAEASLSKPLYKIELYLLKVIPMIMAALCLANTTLFYFGIDATILTYMGGVSFLTLGFLYLSSYVFRFCAYHRMFLHYIVVNDGINYFDYYVGIPLSYRGLLVTHFIIVGVFLLIILYLHQKWKEEQKNILLNSLREP
jgi:hypothetical protein